VVNVKLLSFIALDLQGNSMGSVVYGGVNCGLESRKSLAAICSLECSQPSDNLTMSSGPPSRNGNSFRSASVLLSVLLFMNEIPLKRYCEA